ncbi:hypothetical protein ACL598_01925 [Bordetella bronchialis]|uniref:hypothetical protein n=1 Tax=Bordetella bronchialis TaxID=463025 RepID=UPI003D04F87F
MAAIQGPSVSISIQGDSAAERPRDAGVKRPFTVRARTRKRLGTVIAAALESIAMSFHGVPDQSAPRAGSDTRKMAYKLRKIVDSLLDKLAAGRDHDLPQLQRAFHVFLGIVAVMKFDTSWERLAQPFIDVYMRNATREELLWVHNRLNELAGAVSLFAAMNDTNRQDVQGVMAVLKRSAMQELAERGIGVHLGMLAGSLSAAEPDARRIGKAWFAIEQGLGQACKEGLPPLEYLQAGLERLPAGSTRILAAVLAPHVPGHARMARYLLDTVLHDTLRDVPLEGGLDALDIYMMHEAVRSHVLARVDARVADTAPRLENAARPGVRTAEVANRLWHDIRYTLESLGWVYLETGLDHAWQEKAAIDAETERQFARAVLHMHPRTAAACLDRVDTERLLTMHAHLPQWDGQEYAHLAGLVGAACDARFAGLLGAVQAARAELDTILRQDRRIATARGLLALSDALSACERFASRAAGPANWRDDPLVDAAIRRAAETLRMPGEPGHVLGAGSLRELADGGFAALRQCDDVQVARGVALDPEAVAAEIARRTAKHEALVADRLARLSDVLRNPALSPRSFMGIVASIALADVWRRETRSAFRGGPAGPAADTSASSFNREVAMMLYRKDGAMPVQWMEARRHIAGLSGVLARLRMAAGHARPYDAQGPAARLATVDAAIALLDALGRHFGVHAEGTTAPQRPHAASGGTDPYWNEDSLAEIAPFFGLRYEAGLRMALPLCGAMHQARLLAALGLRMAQPERSQPCSIAAPGIGAPGVGASGIVASGIVASDAQAAAGPVWGMGGPRTLQVDKHFHDAAYRRGELSLSVDAVAAPPASAARAVAAGGDLTRQSDVALNRMVALLAARGDRMDVAWTRLMSAMSQGVADFVLAARDMPEMWRWSHIPEPESVRHVHFEIGQLPLGGYRVDVSACLETARPDMEVQLAFSVRVNASAGRVTGLIVAPQARVLPAGTPLSGNGTVRPVTTAATEYARIAPSRVSPLPAAAGA